MLCCVVSLKTCVVTSLVLTQVDLDQRFDLLTGTELPHRVDVFRELAALLHSQDVQVDGIQPLPLDEPVAPLSAGCGPETEAPVGGEVESLLRRPVNALPPAVAVLAGLRFLPEGRESHETSPEVHNELLTPALLSHNMGVS